MFCLLLFFFRIFFSENHEHTLLTEKGSYCRLVKTRYETCVSQVSPKETFQLCTLYRPSALGGYYSRSSPRRLRYDCESEAGLVYLEASYEEGGQTIVQKVSDLLQVQRLL